MCMEAGRGDSPSFNLVQVGPKEAAETGVQVRPMKARRAQQTELGAVWAEDKIRKSSHIVTAFTLANLIMCFVHGLTVSVTQRHFTSILYIFDDIRMISSIKVIPYFHRMWLCFLPASNAVLFHLKKGAFQKQTTCLVQSGHNQL